MLLVLLCTQDLSYYKYDKMVNRSLALLNKFYSSKSRLFKMGVQAMVCSPGVCFAVFNLGITCRGIPLPKVFGAPNFAELDSGKTPSKLSLILCHSVYLE